MSGRLRRWPAVAGRTPAGLLPAVGDGVRVALSVLAGLAAWQALVLATDLPTVVLPSPAAVADAAVANAPSMLANLRYTGVEIGLGWLVGVGAGVALAVALAASARLRLVVYPYLLAVRLVPVVVVAPVLVVVLGATLATRVTVAALLAFFPVTVATLDGLLAAPEDQVALLRSVGAPDWRVFVHVRVPNAAPGLFAGLKIATPLAVEGAVLAEFLASSRGVGHAMLVAANRLDTALLFAYVLVLVALGVTVFGAVALLDRLVPWGDDADAFGADRLWTGGSIAGDLGGRAVPTAVVGAAAFLGAWHLAVGAVPGARLFVPVPGEVAAVLVSSPGLFVGAAVDTLAKLVAGWTVGAAAGFALGAAAALVPGARVPVYSYLVGVRVLPVVAFAPVLLVWLGVSFAAGVVLVALATFFPVAVGTAAGLDRLPGGYRDLLRLVDAPAPRALAVRLRYGTPELLAGVKLSVVTALSGVVVAEWFVAADGLGVLVLQQTRTFQPALAFGAIAVLFVVGGGLFGLVAAVQRRLRW